MDLKPGIRRSASDAEWDVRCVESMNLPVVVEEGEVARLLSECGEDDGEIWPAERVHLVIAVQRKALALDRSASCLFEGPVLEEGKALGLGAGVVDVAEVNDVVGAFGYCKFPEAGGVDVVRTPVGEQGDSAVVRNLDAAGGGCGLEGIFRAKVFENAEHTGRYPDYGIALASCLQFRNDVVFNLRLDETGEGIARVVRMTLGNGLGLGFGDGVCEGLDCLKAASLGIKAGKTAGLIAGKQSESGRGRLHLELD